MHCNKEVYKTIYAHRLEKHCLYATVGLSKMSHKKGSYYLMTYIKERQISAHSNLLQRLNKQCFILLLCGMAMSVHAQTLGVGAQSIAAGSDHSCAVYNSAAWCWGLNNEGRLGNLSVGRRSLVAVLVEKSR